MLSRYISSADAPAFLSPLAPGAGSICMYGSAVAGVSDCVALAWSVSIDCSVAARSLFTSAGVSMAVDSEPESLVLYERCWYTFTPLSGVGASSLMSFSRDTVGSTNPHTSVVTPYRFTASYHSTHESGDSSFGKGLSGMYDIVLRCMNDRIIGIEGIRVQRFQLALTIDR